METISLASLKEKEDKVVGTVLISITLVGIERRRLFQLNSFCAIRSIKNENEPVYHFEYLVELQDTSI